MNSRKLRNRCRTLVDALDLPVPFDAGELCRRVGAARGRQIHLRPLAMPAGGPCGMWVSADAGDFIFYERHTSGLHQEHIVVHELGHLLSDHASTAAAPELARLLMPSLDPNLVRRVLGRTHYTDVEEQEAELIASLILQRANRHHRAPADATDLDGRLRGSFEPRT